MSSISISKYFVHVPASASRAAVVNASQTNKSKIYFLEGTGEIINSGLVFGCDADTLVKVQKALKSFLGDNAEGTVEDAVKKAIDAVIGTPGDPYTADTVLGAKALTNGLTIAVEDVPTSEAPDAPVEKSIVLKNAAGEVQASIPAAEFIKDGMIDTVAWSTGEGKDSTLVITWNTDAGKEVTEIDMTKFIDTYTVAAGSENYLGIAGYEVSAKTTVLGNVNLIFDEETKKWSAPAEVTTSTGLASAADVATEIVNNERVIAAALNDHEKRIKTLEAVDVVETTVAGDIYVNVTDANEPAPGAERTNNDHDYTIALTVSEYTGVDGAKELSEGLVDNTALKSVLEDLWETFA